MEAVRWFLKRLNRTATGPRTPVLGVCLKGVKAGTQTCTGAPGFGATSFIIARMWEPPKCPSIGEWTSKTIEPYNGILHTHEKEGRPNTRFNMDGLGNTMLSEGSQTQKTNAGWGKCRFTVVLNGMENNTTMNKQQHKNKLCV